MYAGSAKLASKKIIEHTLLSIRSWEEERKERLFLLKTTSSLFASSSLLVFKCVNWKCCSVRQWYIELDGQSDGQVYTLYGYIYCLMIQYLCIEHVNCVTLKQWKITTFLLEKHSEIQHKTLSWKRKGINPVTSEVHFLCCTGNTSLLLKSSLWVPVRSH